MGSETPANIRIFFKDKQNELKGPFTEVQVQEWYRRKWFESSFPFYFMTGDERPTEETEFITLDTLRSLNGIGCPFTMNRFESNSKKMEEKLAKLEKELADLSQKCDEVKEMEKRLEAIEKKLNELSMQQLQIGSNDDAATESTTVAGTTVDATEKDSGKDAESIREKTNPEDKEEEKEVPETVMQERDPKREDAMKKFNEWTDFVSDFYMAYVEVLHCTCEESLTKLWTCCDEAMTRVRLIMEHEEARLMCVEKIIEKMKEKTLLGCSMCDCLMLLNYKQFFIHTIDPGHIEKETFLALNPIFAQSISIFNQICGNSRSMWKAEEEAFLAEISKKYADVPVNRNDMRPTTLFCDDLESRYVSCSKRMVASLMKGRHPSSYDRSQSLPLIAANLQHWKNAGFADRLMAELHEHIGEKMTYCSVCKIVTGTREEYYRHLLLYSHKMKSDENPKINHYQFLAVNMVKKDLVYQ